MVAGRYRIESRLGSGGMSTVHLAFDERLERYVAVKLLAEHLASDPAFVSRFQREALAAARLIHPNIVQVFDSGLDEHRDQHYIVMEYIDGQSCAEILRDRGWLPVEEALPIVLGACAGPRLRPPQGRRPPRRQAGQPAASAPTASVKLADFGIAKATEQSSITQIGSVLGTAAYLAPEQGRGEEAGPPADIYALGVVTYQLLSGPPAVRGRLADRARDQAAARAAARASTSSSRRSRPELASAVGVALRIDPRQRYPTAAEMARALEEGARGIEPGHGHRDRAAAPAAARARAPRPWSSTTERTRASPARRRARRASRARASRAARPVPRAGAPRRVRASAESPRPIAGARPGRRDRRRDRALAAVQSAACSSSSGSFSTAAPDARCSQLTNLIDNNTS